MGAIDITYHDTDYPSGANPSLSIQIFAILFTTFYACYVVCTSILFYLRRKDYYIKKRAPELCMISSVCNLMIVVTYLTRYTYFENYPCFVILWVNSFCYPMFLVSSFLARGWDLYFSYHSNKAKLLEGFSSGRRDSNHDSAHSPAVHRKRSSVDLGTLPITSRGKVSATSVGYKAYKNRIPFFVVIIAILHIILTIISQFYTTQYGFILGKCTSVNPNCIYENIAHYLFIGGYGLIGVPFILHKLSTVDDAFGIKRDICYSLFVGLPFLVCYMFWRYADATYYARLYFPPFSFLIIAFGLYHTISVTMPCYYSYKINSKKGPFPVNELNHEETGGVRLRKDEQRKSLSLAINSIDDLFDDPVLLEQFREFTVIEFSVENLFFYEAYRNFKQALLICCFSEDDETLKRNSIVEERRKSIAGFDDKRRKSVFYEKKIDDHILMPSRRRQSIAADGDKRLPEIPEESMYLDSEELPIPGCSSSHDAGAPFSPSIILKTGYDDFVHVSLNPSSIQIHNSVLKQQMLEIYNQYIMRGSPYELNLNDVTRRNIEEHINADIYTSTLFDQAAEEILMLMSSWSLPRFLSKQRESSQSYSLKSMYRNV